MSKRILAADDSAAMREILGVTLEEAGYDVTTASDGQEALALALKSQFDLVLTDQHMPAMDGLKLIQSLRQMEAYDAVPILVLTTEFGESFKLAARDAGASGWLLKPIDPLTLAEVVAELIAHEDA
ncbi:response regulator [Pararobbsia silviterrae]|uniref:Response regulator n=1 Tax=Pararobbsia silviterrae TaxID=1792498 RepID=A0A494Y8D8_9BURK|nr:response regulator [Pararobbsia silviterrae]RKP58395.1 response regulator [Pararobbsia silviterrae]